MYLPAPVLNATWRNCSIIIHRVAASVGRCYAVGIEITEYHSVLVFELVSTWLVHVSTWLVLRVSIWLNPPIEIVTREKRRYLGRWECKLRTIAHFVRKKKRCVSLLIELSTVAKQRCC